MYINKGFLKFFYNALLTGMPSLTYNPFNKNVLHAPFIVDEQSTYINFRLNNEQFNKIQNFIKHCDNGLTMVPASLLRDNSKDYFLSINIYNCTSPVFSFIDSDPVTRCELNIYVKDKNGDRGTLIIDYVSNILSMDPDHLFKPGGEIQLKEYCKKCEDGDLCVDIYNNKCENNKIISGMAKNNKFDLKFNYNLIKNVVPSSRLSSNLVKFTDRIYYNNGIYDKLYYDSSLIHNKIVDCREYDVEFKFLGMDFKNVDSVFYFEKEINFVGGLWQNVLKE
jgi:hypothetical protein